MKGYLIYNKVDYNKNIWFINHIINKFKSNNIIIKLLIHEDIIINNNLIKLDKYDFIINRTRNHNISILFNKLNYKIYNKPNITYITNDKYLTYNLIKELNINCLPYNIYNNKLEYKLPIIIKKRDGHGGLQVHLINNNKELTKYNDTYLIQEYNKDIIGDIRVYIINNKVITSIIRLKNNDFRTNASLGAIVKEYTITPKLNKLLDIILSNNQYDFVGIDFLIDDKDNLYFNEIEDVVGCRSLYQLGHIDIIDELVKYIKEDISI